jgi:hypothetical protein
MSRMIAYDVRLERRRARVTVRVAAVDAAEARAQALFYARPGWEVVACRRSQYAFGQVHREARRDWLIHRREETR